MSDSVTRVLLIEDNPDDACLLREALNEAREAHIDLVHVEHLDEAAKLLRQETFPSNFAGSLVTGLSRNRNSFTRTGPRALCAHYCIDRAR